MSERPWMKWYPTDWRADSKLRICSLAARGLWIEMLGMMYEATPIGHLVLNGKAPTSSQLAVLVGADIKTVNKALSELEVNGVFSKTEAGIIYSRRMVKDAERAAVGREHISKRWGNPGGDDGAPSSKPDSRPNRVNGSEPIVKATSLPIRSSIDSPITQRPEARYQKERKASVVSPELTRDHVSAPKTHTASQIRMPTLNDPPARWIPFADKTEIDREGVERPVVGGYYLDGVAMDVCRAARIDGYGRALDWSPIAKLLREGYDPETDILPVIYRMAARSNYKPPQFLSYFDRAIREGKAA